MPARRGLPARATQQRNAKLEPEPVMRTRGRGVKSTPTKLSASTDLPRTSPRQVKTKVIIYGTDDDSEASFARPSSSDGSVAYREEEETPEPASRIKCEVDEKGILSVFSLPTLFLSQLLETEKRSQRQARLYAGQFTQSDLDTTTEEDVPTPPPTTSGRGRGRGGRGGRGRGRGGRGRGRGGAGATASSLTRALSPERVSPTRTRKPRGGARNVAPRPEEDASHSANQNSVAKTAKTTEMDHIEDPQDVQMEDASEDDDKEEEDTRMQDFSRTVMKESLDFTSPRKNKRGGAQTKPPPAKDRSAREEPGSVTPATPPPVSSPEITEKVAQGTLVGRAAALIAQESASQTPANGTSTRAASPVPPLIDPEDDILSDSDLPEPFLDDYVPPATEAECDDRADFLLKTRFKPMTDVQDIIASLTKFAPSQRSTENLYRLAQNTQKILQAWQDEYLKLDAKTAPHAHPPKKPAHGGRVPINPLVFEDMKEADLYGYVFDARKPPGGQDPFAQRIGAEKMGRRELRQRRNRDMLDSAAQSEEEGEGEGRATGRRQRRATRRFDAIVSEQPSGANTPKKNNGWGGARKRGVSKFAKETSETPEPDGRPAKRPKILGAGPLHPRIQEMREESAVPSSSEEAATPDTIETQEPEEQQPRPGPAEEGRKRGRPAGSKNTGRRSDYGIKKGPRKKPAEVPVVPVPAATMPSANAPPPVLQSLSEGQNQFSIDPQAQVSNPQHHVLAPAVPPPPPPPPMAPQPVATVFQATPQPLGMLDTQPRPSQPGEPHPDQYISTTPLSHYTHPYTDSAATSPTSGSKRKPRVKSEKRSQSMTIWWAERKAKQKELEALNGPATAGSPTDGSAAGGSKSSTPKPTSRRGGRGGSSRAEQSPRLHPDPNTREAYPTPPPPPPSTHAHPGHMEYMQQAPQHPPPGQMLMQHSPLAAMPSGPPQPMPPVPPQLQQFQGPPQPMSTRPSMPVLAPAPMPPQLQSYPSPYGPRSAPRPKSSGPPPLAPAPPTTHTHISPYPPAHGHGPHGPHGHGHGHGPILQREMMEMPFKVLVPGPPPPPPQGEERRG